MPWRAVHVLVGSRRIACTTAGTASGRRNAISRVVVQLLPHPGNRHASYNSMVLAANTAFVNSTFRNQQTYSPADHDGPASTSSQFSNSAHTSPHTLARRALSPTASTLKCQSSTTNSPRPWATCCQMSHNSTLLYNSQQNHFVGQRCPSTAANSITLQHSSLRLMHHLSRWAAAAAQLLKLLAHRPLQQWGSKASGTVAAVTKSATAGGRPRRSSKQTQTHTKANTNTNTTCHTCTTLSLDVVQYLLFAPCRHSP